MVRILNPHLPSSEFERLVQTVWVELGCFERGRNSQDNIRLRICSALSQGSQTVLVDPTKHSQLERAHAKLKSEHADDVKLKIDVNLVPMLSDGYAVGVLCNNHVDSMKRGNKPSSKKPWSESVNMGRDAYRRAYDPEGGPGINKQAPHRVRCQCHSANPVS
mmetsp:Transcript_65169/g.108273  ORF Transcript_65169/g.108273 Transcript_65169/m.108273 type:complete len:162 (-) Transcript_65169:205-690(-)